MVTSVSHIALFVPDLQEAEKFYMDFFDMELIGRDIKKKKTACGTPCPVKYFN